MAQMAQMCQLKMSYINRGAIVLTTPKRNELLHAGPPESMCHSCHILGRGSYGTVFKAIYREHSVALKVVKNRAISTLHSEAHVLNWRHRNIVRLLKLESTPEFGLIIMERSNGLCLQRVLDSLALPLVHRVLITLDVLAALRYCHCRFVLHLDVKPANVLIELGTKSTKTTKTAGKHSNLYKRSYICKLCDFGSSLKLGESRDNQVTANGTLRYMAPEALRSSPLSYAADIYSLGISMWQLQARRLPFYTLTCNETIAYQVVKHNLRPDNYTQLEELQLRCDQSNSPNHLYSYLNQSTSGLDVALELYSKARRNLNFDSSHGRVKKRSAIMRRKQPRLAQYFNSSTTDYSDSYLESAYTDIYRSCWIGQPELRLSSTQLQEGLELILAKYVLNK